MQFTYAHGVSITGKPTVPDPHHPHADDAQASLRTELLGQIAAAQFDLEAVIAELGRSGTSAGLLDSQSQLGALNALRQQVGSASTASLSTMRAEIAAAIATGQATAQQARTDAASKPDEAEVISLAREARAHVDAVMHGMKDFDSDLRFPDARDAAEYRVREDERRAYIAAQLAKSTPEGDLNAAGGAIGQMADAAAHGAADNPQFQERWDKLVQSTEALRAQLVRDGGNVAEFDARLREDLRRILKSKGLSDAEIEKRLAEHPDNPLDAVKGFVAEQKGVIGEKEISELSAKAQEHKDAAEEKTAVKHSLEASSPLIDAMAKFKASGVIMGDHALDQPTHGVTASVAVAAPTRAL